MNGMKVLAGEFAVAVALESWPGIKQNVVPWPALIVRTALGFSALALIALLSEELAALLGAGYLIALFLKKPQYYTGKPDSYDYTAQSTMNNYLNELLFFGPNQLKSEQVPPGQTPSKVTPGGG